MDIVQPILDNSPRVALQFSGGRDSLAMLLYLRPLWDRLTVYFLNTGDEYPETLALIDKVRKVVPHLVEVAGKVNETRERFGWPSDVLQPGAMWPDGAKQIAGHTPLIDRYWCCFQSSMLPMHERMVEDGIKVILRGQRDSDNPKSHVKNGEEIGGFTIFYPIASWRVDEVETFIRASHWEVPPFYAEGMTSMPDCMHCTAWLEHGALGYLKRHHPVEAAEVQRRLVKIRAVVSPALAGLDAAISD